MGDAPMITNNWAGGSYQASKRIMDDLLDKGIVMRDRLKSIPVRCPKCNRKRGDTERLAGECFGCK